jgi:hypothetical protein
VARADTVRGAVAASAAPAMKLRLLNILDIAFS